MQGHQYAEIDIVNACNCKFTLCRQCVTILGVLIKLKAQFGKLIFTEWRLRCYHVHCHLRKEMLVQHFIITSEILFTVNYGLTLAVRVFVCVL